MEYNRKLIFGIGVAFLIILGICCLLTQHKQSGYERRVELLQKALAPGSPRQAANSWAEAVKQRNGAWQYALLSKALQDKYLDQYEKLNWVTGTSSPWVDNYEIDRIGEKDAGHVQYEIKFHWYTSDGYFGSSVAKIWVTASESGNEKTWYITEIKYSETEMDKNVIAYS